MANLKEIRNRIASISSTMQITGAMKMVSAAKLKKAQDAIVMLRPYSEKLQELIQDVSSAVEPENLPVYAQQREVQNILYVVITSNRGLAGAFNSNIIKEVHHRLNGNSARASVMTIGKKGHDAMRRDQTVHSNQSELYENLRFERVSQVASAIMRDFRAGKFDQVFLVYNKFVNAASQIVTTEQLLPIRLADKVEGEVETDYIFEPSREEILTNLLPKSIKTQLYKALLDSVASEHGARMTAMHKATDNASAIKTDLVIHYNKARQAAITGEILEIVSGAEALKGS